MGLPKFFIIGASRSGTNSLRATLCQIDMIEPAQRKEIHFFDKSSEYIKGLKYYKSFFTFDRTKICFDTTPNYLYSFEAPLRIKKDLPESCHKFIVLLRNPVDRAWSNYWHWRYTIPKSELFNPNSEVLRRGRYIEYLRRWIQLYRKNQFFIIKAETFFQKSVETVNFILEYFLELPYRVTRALYYDPKKSRPTIKIPYPRPDKKVFDFLTEYYQRPNLELYLKFGIDWE